MGLRSAAAGRAAPDPASATAAPFRNSRLSTGAAPAGRDADRMGLRIPRNRGLDRGHFPFPSLSIRPILYIMERPCIPHPDGELEQRQARPSQQPVRLSGRSTSALPTRELLAHKGARSGSVHLAASAHPGPASATAAPPPRPQPVERLRQRILLAHDRAPTESPHPAASTCSGPF